MRKFQVKGVVCSGFGRGRLRMKELHDYYRVLTGMDFYLGTLNIKLTILITFYDGLEIQVPYKTSYEKVNLIPAYVNEIKGFIIRPENLRHPAEVVEFICPICMRNKFHLKDGDIVIVEIEKQYVRNINCKHKQSCNRPTHRDTLRGPNHGHFI